MDRSHRHPEACLQLGTAHEKTTKKNKKEKKEKTWIATLAVVCRQINRTQLRLLLDVNPTAVYPAIL